MLGTVRHFITVKRKPTCVEVYNTQLKHLGIEEGGPQFQAQPGMPGKILFKTKQN